MKKYCDDMKLTTVRSSQNRASHLKTLNGLQTKSNMMIVSASGFTKGGIDKL